MDAIGNYSYSGAVQGSTQGVQATKETKAAEADPALNTAAAESAAAELHTTTKAANTDEAKSGEDKDQKSASQKQIEEAVKAINKHAEGTEAIFGIHDKTNRVTIKIIDKKTHDVIKEFPPEKTLDLIAKAWEMAGIIVDDKR